MFTVGCTVTDSWEENRTLSIDGQTTAIFVLSLRMQIFCLILPGMNAPEKIVADNGHIRAVAAVIVNRGIVTAELLSESYDGNVLPAFRHRFSPFSD